MTDERRGFDGPVGPPWSVDVLADLHAGVLDDREAAELWPKVDADPGARAIIEALEATTTELSSLGSEVEPMPAEVAERIDATLALQRRPENGRVVSLDAARKRRNRRFGWGAAFLAAAAAAVAAVVITVPNSTAGTPDMAEQHRQPTGSEQQPLALSSGNLGSAVGAINGVRDFGPLGNEQRLDACLEASGLDADVRPVGIRPVTVDGQDAVMVLYTTGQLAQFRLVAVAPDCGPGNPGVLLDKTVGRQGG